LFIDLLLAVTNHCLVTVGGCCGLQGSWFEPLQAAGAPLLAGVVSNPPYIRSAEMPGLQAEVSRCGPRLDLLPQSERPHYSWGSVSAVPLPLATCLEYLAA
jgi:methylase of polypeptide subunit release factors